MSTDDDRTRLLELTLMRQFGDRLATARREAGLSATAMARAVGVSRNTLRAAECGEPTVVMGTYVRMLSVLGLLQDLVLVGTGAQRSDASVSSGAATLAARHARLAEEVSAGQREAESLVAMSPKLTRQAKVTFPKNGFGKPKAW